jgi:hypothetical protein
MRRHICVYAREYVIEHDAGPSPHAVELAGGRWFDNVEESEKQEGGQERHPGLWQEGERQQHSRDLVDHDKGRVVTMMLFEQRGDRDARQQYHQRDMDENDAIVREGEKPVQRCGCERTDSAGSDRSVASKEKGAPDTGAPQQDGMRCSRRRSGSAHSNSREVWNSR